MLRASGLTEFIIVERPSGEKNENDEPIPSAWIERARLWANVRFLSGKEYVVSGAVRGSAVASMRIRYRADIDEQMRVRYGGRLYDITAVLPARARGYVDLLVKVGEKYV
ncbi:phage head closure protein [Burkholderia pseudomallei]|uniref:Phage head-tail adaptor, putative n=1 Tax=Burkholderia thailandensis (strain ATCC 700388 / DSM 13276 / CCUG 48851 / CIP 106301 / E264) TaxID=271848 RepID=Q2T6F2_BURTA|nr:MULTISPECIES: phage head closure protein [pseudomallei group]UYE89897.1 head-tail adaptor [Burkholderia phage PhiBt-E264.1]ABC35672.1 phage head-tail adaptor, putative [Burkholderia thailandensis E264]AHI76277.1 phage head-tail joining family protein [Burkholderia thailandensis 2002721723]AIP29305.1 phage head-tail joining family protein [Burkholderia thailandensis E264]AJY02926.1 phage head-tail joining family protein [Burkholderia thailandensis 2002721643]